MRLHRFFVEEPIRDSRPLIIEDEAFINQLKNVFRYKRGNKVIIFDNSGFEYEAVIDDILNSGVKLKIESQKDGLKSNKNVYLCFSLLKKDNNDWIIQKATELGVCGFYPLVSERSEKKAFNEQRAKKIVIEATEQSGWSKIPYIYDVSSLKETIDVLKEYKKIAFDTKSVNKIDENLIKENNIAIFIGPEGGWTDSEINLFKENNINMYSLGKSVLRAETATIVALAKIL